MSMYASAFTCSQHCIVMLNIVTALGNSMTSFAIVNKGEVPSKSKESMGFAS